MKKSKTGKNRGLKKRLSVMFSDPDSAKIKGIKDEIHEIERMLKALIKSMENILEPLHPGMLDPCIPENWEKN